MNVILDFFRTIGLLIYYTLQAFITLFIPNRFRTTKSIYGEIALVTGAGSGKYIAIIRYILLKYVLFHVEIALVLQELDV